MSQEDEYDERVAELNPGPFVEAAACVHRLIRSGQGGWVYFEPGDATRYQIEVGGRTTCTVMNGGRVVVGLAPIDSTSVSFGTASQSCSELFGRLGELHPGHPWTAAVWRRLREVM